MAWRLTGSLQRAARAGLSQLQADCYCASGESSSFAGNALEPMRTSSSGENASALLRLTELFRREEECDLSR